MSVGFNVCTVVLCLSNCNVCTVLCLSFVMFIQCCYVCRLSSLYSVVVYVGLLYLYIVAMYVGCNVCTVLLCLSDCNVCTVLLCLLDCSVCKVFNVCRTVMFVQC